MAEVHMEPYNKLQLETSLFCFQTSFHSSNIDIDARFDGYADQ